MNRTSVDLRYSMSLGNYPRYTSTGTHRGTHNDKKLTTNFISKIDHALGQYGLLFIPLALGCVLGLAISSVVLLQPGNSLHSLAEQLHPVTQDWPPAPARQVDEEVETPDDSRSSLAEDSDTSFLYVGVMTAEKFLTTRAQAVNSTWGKLVDRLEFFSQNGQSQEHNMNIVNLQDVDDSVYPPQKKVFHMLRYMCEHHIDNFRWFMRADDDVYVKVDRLTALLATMDHHKVIYLGQPGYGTEKEKPTLGLDGGNFCMGGPGVIFSRPALRGLCPHIEQCLREVYSDQEDVEIGRCVTKHLGLQCTRAWETLKLFYHSYETDYPGVTPYLGDLDNDLHYQQAVTLHHAKQPHVMFNIHFHHRQDQYRQILKDLHKTRHQLSYVQRILEPANRSNIDNSESVDITSSVEWNTFNIHSISSSSPVSAALVAQLQEVVDYGVSALNSGSQNAFKFRIGYWRHLPGVGMEYMLDMESTNKTANPTPGTDDGASQMKRLYLKSLYTIEKVKLIPESSKRIPGQFKICFQLEDLATFGKFMKSFEDNIISKQLDIFTEISVAFIGVYKKREENQIRVSHKMIQQIREKYSHVTFSVEFKENNPSFSSVDLFYASLNKKALVADTLFIYMRTDVQFDLPFLERCRMNTVQGKYVFHAYSADGQSPKPRIANGELLAGHVICGFSSDFKRTSGPKKQRLKLSELFNDEITVFVANDTSLKLIN